jgi:hypothetical protein
LLEDDDKAAPEAGPNMALVHRLAAGFIILVGAFLGWKSAELQFYTPVGPGAGFFPVWLSLALAVLGAVMLVQSYSADPEPMPDDFAPGRPGAVRILATLAGVVFFVLALGPLGFRLTTFLLSLCLVHVFGSVRPWVSVPVSAGLSLGVYLIFSDVLKIALPLGPFGI